MKKDSLSSKKPFERHFDELERKWFDVSRTFDQFLDITVDALMWLDKPYDHAETHAKALADLITIMEDSAQSHKHKISDDYLGEFYMQFISQGHNGQYFTPQHVSDMMAQMTMPTTQEIGRKITVADASGCWSGRMLLAAAKVAGKREIIATGVDLDATCCKMALINCFLNGIDANIYNMNWLSMEFYQWRAVRMRPRPQVRPVEYIKQETKEAIKEAIQRVPQTLGQQLSLF